MIGHYRNMDGSTSEAAAFVHGPVDFVGDAYLTFTAPFYVDRNPLVPGMSCVVPLGDHLDEGQAFRRQEVRFGPLLQGSLTFELPTVDVLATFAGGDAWCEELRQRLGRLLAARSSRLALTSVAVMGILCQDGYAAVAVTLTVAGGWERDRRPDLIAAVGPAGRDDFSAALRMMLLDPATQLIRRSVGADVEVALPYFNLTYGGRTGHPMPGRAALADELRILVYPNSPEPLPSRSPWHHQYFYPGYAFNLLAMPDAEDCRRNLHKLALLLLILDVSYARLARTARAADRALWDGQRGGYGADAGWLERLERRLRSDYQALVTPTFSYDHHALMLRDGILDAWDAAGLETRAEDLLAAVRQILERELAEEQAQRVARVNTIVTILTVLSAIATIEAVVSLVERIL
jgi:hypothetical protein